ncbi:MAG TPA: alpha/beta family hydrolase [Thermoleophilaceae bacterium]|nr:alpha/beta family hydrolase [Thermoleophilaceae bacterium]
MHLHDAARPKAALMLGHGAAGGVGTPDLQAATEVATAEGFRVVLVEQPYRVAGKRSSPAPPKLDEAWLAVVEHVRGGELAGLPLVTGGRSAGARVACRTAAACKAAGVLCLAFPLHPPGRPEKSRQPELDAVSVPTLVVQGESDPFGMPVAGANREVVTVAGNHSLKADLDAVARAVRSWLVGELRAAWRASG